MPADPPFADLAWDPVRRVTVSPRFQDVYHSEAGALAQARHVFMGGCELPARWRGRPVFTIVETGFGLGLNFLATWQAWLEDPGRCARLHFVSIEAYPVSAEDLRLAVARSPGLAPLRPLADALAQRYPAAPRPGVHRLRFPHPERAGQAVALTLAIGDAAHVLPQLRARADAAYLDGFSPARNPELWQPRIFKGVARLLQPNALAATWSVAAAVRKGLAEAGFIVSRRPGLPPKRDALQARYLPWALRTAAPQQAPGDPSLAQPDARAPARPDAARRAIVIGAGIAGAAASWALAQRGWQVTLIDAGAGPAAGASGLPVGIGVPHLSPDDAVVSRLTRAGAHWMRQVLQDIALPPDAWQDGAVWQVLDGLPDDAPEGGDGGPSWVATPAFSPAEAGKARDRIQALGGQFDVDLPGGYRGAAVAHAHGLRVKGRPLVARWLAQCPGLQTHWNTRIAQLRRPPATLGTPAPWQALDAAGRVLAQADVVIVATAMAATELAPVQASVQAPIQTPVPQVPAPAPAQVAPGDAPPALLTPLRGQITLGRWPGGRASGAALCLTGHGHFIGNWAGAGRGPDSRVVGASDAARPSDWDWAMGSSFERGDSALAARAASDLDNLDKLRHLAPELARDLHPQFAGPPARRGSGLQPWVQVRATTPDRLPLAGPVPDWDAAQAAPVPGAGAGGRKPAKAAWTLDTLPRQAGLYMLSGLGARGLTLAALCAELIACQIEGEPWPLDAALAHAVDPARFDLKRSRRGDAAARPRPQPAP